MKPAQALAEHVFKDDNFKIVNWDLDRIYIERDSKEYIIRMWNIAEKKDCLIIDWTLFLSVANHGKEKKRGVFKYVLPSGS